MKKIFALCCFIGLNFIMISFEVRADCSSTVADPGTNFDFGTVIVSADSPVGSVISTKTQTFVYTPGVVKCTNSWEQNIVNRTFQTISSQGGNIYNTNVDGVGIRVFAGDQGNAVNPLPFSVPHSPGQYGFGPSPTDVRVELIKTGPITGGTITTGEVFLDEVREIGQATGIRMGHATLISATIISSASSCTINDDNTLNVNLGSVDRAQLPTTPGTGQLIHIQIPVECTSGSGATDVSINMQLSYTPLTVSGTEVVQSSTNGLGVSIIYNNQPLSPTDITPLTFLIGSNSLDLAFEAVREPSVNIGDISTGEFTASAVLVMTQQ